MAKIINDIHARGQGSGLNSIIKIWQSEKEIVNLQKKIICQHC